MHGRPPAWIDASWWEVYGAELRAAELSRQDWINRLALAWCLVRVPESLTAAELAQQEDYTDRLMGRKFYTTTEIVREQN